VPFHPSGGITNPPLKSFRFLELLGGLFAGLLVISNLASARLIEVGPFSFDAGTLVFPLTYILGDLLTEVYGYARSRRIIWTAFLTLLISFFTLKLVSLFPTPPGQPVSAAWDEIVGLTPRIALASLVAFLAGEFSNSMVLSRMKAKAPQKNPAARFILSTLFGQVLDTILFAFIAFLGTIPMGLMGDLLLSNYIYKVGIEILFLPLTLLLARALKRSEGTDAVDQGISLTPFGWSLPSSSEGAPGA
jgi:uncharacterized integral membrane protein (TIGR00697 family)